jgi:hypothetical protein
LNPFDRIASVLDSDLPKVERWVMVVMMRWAIHDGVTFPGVKRIMREAGLSERSVRNGIASLRARGLLVPDGISYLGTKRYIVKPPAPSAAPRQEMPPPGTERSPDRHPVPPRPAPDAPKTGNTGSRQGTTPQPPEGELIEFLIPGVRATMENGADPLAHVDEVVKYVQNHAPSHLTKRKRTIKAALALAVERVEEG